MPATGFDATAGSYLVREAAVVTAAPATMAIWHLPRAPTVAGVCLEVHASGSATNRNCMQIGNNQVTAGSFQATHGSGSGISAATIGSATQQTIRWQHVAGIFASTSSRTAYLNGVAGSAETTLRNFGSTPNRTAIGLAAGSSLGLAVAGLLAHAAVWNVALTAAEIMELSKGLSPIQIRPSALVAYWPLDERNLCASGAPWLNNPLTVRGSVSGVSDAIDPVRRPWSYARRFAAATAVAGAPHFIPESIALSPLHNLGSGIGVQ